MTLKKIAEKSLFVFAGLVTVLATQSVRAEGELPLSFDEVWQGVRSASGHLSAAVDSEGAARIGEMRAHRHWYPQIYLEARQFLTDDPGNALFSKLSERNLGGHDFSPLTLNFPGAQSHARVTLGLRLGLYEGGSRVAQARAASRQTEAKELERKAVLRQEFARAASLYGGLLVSRAKADSLEPITKLVDATIQQYRLGDSSNPVGHSGLLGLRTLRNRLLGEHSALQAQKQALNDALRRLAPLPEKWSPVEEDVESFVERYLKEERADSDSSYAVLAMRSGGQALEELAHAERSRFLPRLGLFGEESYSVGQGASATSFTVGAFLQWNLFSASDYGAIKQASLEASSLLSRAEGERMRQASEYARLSQQSNAIVEQLKFARSSIVLLEEQSRIARRLFTSGSINALQLTEVFSRRVDLVIAKAQAEEQYLSIKAQLMNFVAGEVK